MRVRNPMNSTYDRIGAAVVSIICRETASYTEYFV
jgi:hypothetical protein